MLEMSRDLAARIEEQASDTYPEECCGVLIGTGNQDGRKLIYLYETQNVHSDNRKRRFMIGPDDYRNAERIAREKEGEIIGFYHSHPDHPAVPSEHDREYAWPWYFYVIVSVLNGKPSEIKGWKLRDDRSAFEEVHVDIS